MEMHPEWGNSIPQVGKNLENGSFFLKDFFLINTSFDDSFVNPGTTFQYLKKNFNESGNIFKNLGMLLYENEMLIICYNLISLINLDNFML